MPDMQKLHENKERIVSIIKTKGPSFPSRISRETGISPLFISAFLAELVSEKRLRLSEMKIGSSPLYFLEGQEPELEGFIEHLNSKEKEAFDILKKAKILEDEKQQPAIRVALRGVKDFAHPINVRHNGEIKLFWKFFSLPNDQTKQKIQTLLLEKVEKQKEKPTKTDEVIEPSLKKEEKTKPKKPKEPSEFENNIKSYLATKDIEILEEISTKKKELISKVRIDTLFGKQSYYLIAKDKKKVTTNDLTIALQKAQTEKMPSLFLSPGEPDKKAQEHLKEWRNLIKFEKVKV